MRVAVIGHVEHVTIAPVAGLPARGDIVHLEEPVAIAGGGGGIAFFQLARSDAEVHLFTALGNDDAAREVERQITETGAHIHAARRDAPHTRDLVLITPDGERTIIVAGEPLHPTYEDPLPWDVLETCDAVYVTSQEPVLLEAARESKLLVVTARRREALARSGIAADIVVGSVSDPRESAMLAGFAVRPRVVVMTEGALGGTIETSAGITRFDAPPASSPVGAYGAGDTFAAALTYYAASDMALADACARASRHGAAVLAGINPLEHQLPLPLVPEGQ